MTTLKPTEAGKAPNASCSFGELRSGRTAMAPLNSLKVANLQMFLAAVSKLQIRLAAWASFGVAGQLWPL